MHCFGGAGAGFGRKLKCKSFERGVVYTLAGTVVDVYVSENSGIFSMSTI